MIIVLKPGTSPTQQREIFREIRRLGYKPHPIHGVARTVIGAIGDERTHQSLETLTTWPQVETVMRVQKRYKLVSREAHEKTSVIRVRGLELGGAASTSWPGPARSRARSN